jgi:hypothetical protein
VTDLAPLARKYERLLELRRARARGEPIPERGVFKALAGEFPGCLAELDTLPLGELEARLGAIARALEGAPEEPWMAWMVGYHALFRTALAIKGRVRDKEALGAERVRRIARESGVDEAFVLAVAKPPGGRLATIVLAALERTFGQPAAIIKRALFPRSKV